MILGGFLTSLLSVGMTVYLFGVFQDAMLETFDASVAAFAWGPTIFTGISGTLSPIIGRALATRGRPGWSIRVVMLVGSVGVGAGLIGISRAPSLFIAGCYFAILVAPGAMSLGPLLAQAMITNWFIARRGQALGFVSAGTTIGGVLIPPLAAFLIDRWGWRDAMMALGVLALMAALPAVSLLITNAPEDVGESPDGLRRDAQTDAAPAAGPETTAGLLRRPELWLIGVVFGLMSSGGMVSVVFAVPYASELGLALVLGASVVSMRAGAAALGKVVLGGLSDRFGVRAVLWGVIGVQVVLTTLLIQTHDAMGFIVIAVGLGFVGGAALPLRGALVGSLFGRDSFASAMGLLAMVAMPFSLVMVPVAGLVYEMSGSYAGAFACTLPVFMLAGVLLYFVRPRSAHV